MEGPGHADALFLSDDGTALKVMSNREGTVATMRVDGGSNEMPMIDVGLCYFQRDE